MQIGVTIETITAITDGFRAWGAASALFAIHVVARFVVMAFSGAIMAAKLEWKLAASHGGRRSAIAFAIALWREGWAQPLAVNAWVMVGLMAFLAFAGSAIFLASGLLPLGYLSPHLHIVMAVLWPILSSAGWMFTITTAERPASMVVASAVLLFCFIALGLRMGVAG